MNVLKNIRVFYFSARVFLVLTTFLSIFTLYFWPMSPNSINAFGDTFILGKYETDYRYRLALGNQLTKNNRLAEALETFTSLISDMTHVKKSDHLSKVKKEALTNSITLALELNKIDSAVSHMRYLLEYDSHNIEDTATIAKNFLSIEETKTEGIKLIKDLYLQFPNYNTVAKEYARLLIAEGKPYEAFHSYYGMRFLEAGNNGTWNTLFDNSSGYSESNLDKFKVNLNEKREFNAKMQLRPRTKSFIIQSPIGLGIMIQQGSLTIDNIREKRTIHFDYRNRRCTNIDNASTCTTIINDEFPFLLINIPYDFDMNSGGILKIKATVFKDPIQEFYTLFKDSDEAAARLKEKGYHDDAKLLKELAKHYSST